MRLHLIASLLGSIGIALGAAGAAPIDPQAPPPGFGCHGGAPTVAGGSGRLGIVTGLGDGGYAAEQVGEPARPYFEEGVRLTHDFDAGDAIRAFKAAQALQPDCAMCFWGEAWARGPTINYPIDAKAVGEGRAAALKAKARSTGLSDKAKALIDAEIARYPERAPMFGPPSDNKAYAAAVDRLADRFADDDALAAEAASALLVASGQAWSEGTPKPGSMAARAQARLETVLARSPDFTPAIHFYIHLMEWTHSPEKAAPYAERLAALAPNAGHLVHMPSHLWFRLGRYEEGAVANLKASEADDRDSGAFNTDGGVSNFALHAHNVSFGLASALMSGDRDGALSLARRATREYPDKGVLTKAYQAFGRELPPGEAMAVPEPTSATDKALWRYARTLALAQAGDVAAARREAAAFGIQAAAKGADAGAKDDMLIAKDELAGHIALADKRYDDAVAALRRAADRRDRVDTSMDPPDWGWPPRRALAAALLLKGDRAAAARELQTSLKRFPNDPMALYALSEVRRADGDRAEADRLLAQAKAGWKGDPKALRLDRV